MSWFLSSAYDDPKDLKNVVLRVYSNRDLQDVIRRSRLLRLTDFIVYARVVKYKRKVNSLIVEVASQSLFDIIRRKHRHNLFRVELPYHDDLVCEGDTGKGLHTS